ncbi:hypothetical protein [Brevibacillus agri]
MSENIYEKSVHILLVEDDPVNVQVICNHFSLKGWKVTVVQNGKDALEKIASLPFQVVLLTAKSGTNDVIEGFRSGANDYLTKPVTREELFVRIEAQLTIVKASGELTLLKEAVQAGTSSLRHAVKNDLGVITLFSEKIKEYAEQEQLDAIIQDASVIIRKNNHLFEMMAEGQPPDVRYRAQETAGKHLQMYFTTKRREANSRAGAVLLRKGDVQAWGSFANRKCRRLARSEKQAGTDPGHRQPGYGQQGYAARFYPVGR